MYGWLEKKKKKCQPKINFFLKTLKYNKKFYDVASFSLWWKNQMLTWPHELQHIKITTKVKYLGII